MLDPRQPSFVTRDLTLLRRENDRLPLRSVRLIELIPRVLYVIPLWEPDGTYRGIRELAPGRVLCRNYTVTQRLSPGTEVEADDCFVSYDGVYRVRRALRRIGVRADVGWLTRNGVTGTRVNAIRGISRRVNAWHAACEDYTDALMAIIRQAREALEVRARPQWLSGADRTPRFVRAEAAVLYEEGSRLIPVVARPFNRTATHVSRELLEASRLLVEAANGRNGDTVERAKKAVRQAYRSLCLRETHGRLEEVLYQVAMHHEIEARLPPTLRDILQDELREVHEILTRPDPVTGEAWEEGFTRRVLPHVVPHIHLGRVQLLRHDTAGGPNLFPAAKELKIACEAL